LRVAPSNQDRSRAVFFCVCQERQHVEEGSEDVTAWTRKELDRVGEAKGFHLAEEPTLCVEGMHEYEVCVCSGAIATWLFATLVSSWPLTFVIRKQTAAIREGNHSDWVATTRAREVLRFCVRGQGRADQCWRKSAKLCRRRHVTAGASTDFTPLEHVPESLKRRPAVAWVFPIADESAKLLQGGILS